MGSNPTLSATTFIFLYLQALVSIMVSALHWFPMIYAGRGGLQICRNEATVTAAKLASIS